MILIIIEGPKNSGKSTTSKVIGEILPKTVVIELDHIRHFADCLSLNDSIPYTLEDAGIIANNWLKRGFNVVIDYPMDSEDYEQFLSRIDESEVVIHQFSLSPKLNIALSNRGNRELSDHEIKRIREQYDERSKRSLLGMRIDNSTLSATETAKSILALIDQNS